MDGAIKAQQIFGCSVNWLLHDIGEPRTLVAPPAPPREAEPPQKRGGGKQVSESQLQLLEDFDLLPDEEKHILRTRLAEKARAIRQKADELFFGKHNIPAPVADERIEETFGPAPTKRRMSFGREYNEQIKQKTSSPSPAIKKRG